jgi:peptidoglycan/LPS O-acetylase OafA/YrhL
MVTYTQTKHIPALDGLRGLAILMVICYHYFPSWRLFAIGWTGVDLFFVLSGYLITRKLLSTRGDSDYFRKFYRNRVLRIFPLYYAVLIIFFLAIHFLAKKENLEALSYYTSHWLSFFVFLENWSFSLFGFPQDAYLTHFWSLAIEEQFYLVWPLIIYFISSGRMRLILWSCTVIAVIIIRLLIYLHFKESHYVFNYANTFCRMDSLIIGAVLSQIHASDFKIPQTWTNPISVIISVPLVASIIILGNSWFHNPLMETIGYSCIAICFACLIHVTFQKKNFIAGICKMRFLRFCGKISYGLYVFHWPVLLILGKKITNWGAFYFPGDIFAIQIISLSLSIIISFVLSIISFRYFESYFLALKK